MLLGVGGHHLMAVPDGLSVVLVVGYPVVDTDPVVLLFDDHSVVLAVVVLPVALVVDMCHVVHLLVHTVILVFGRMPVVPLSVGESVVLVVAWPDSRSVARLVDGRPVLIVEEHFSIPDKP